MQDIPPVDFMAEYYENQPSLYRESENLHRVLQAIFDVYSVQQDKLLWLSENILDVDKATGFHLDFIGGLVGQPRFLTDFSAEYYFGFKDAYRSETFGTPTDVTMGGFWNSRSHFNTATSRRLSDSEYRRLIKARVIFNNSNCTANDLIEVANLITSRDDNSTQIMQHGLVRLKTSDETGILSYFVDRVNLLDNILPVAAGVRINLYEDKVLAFTSHPYPPLLEDKTDTYTASVKPLDITLRQILKEGFVDYEGYTPSVKPLDISLFNTLKSRYIDPEEAYTSSVTPLNITLRSILSSTNQDPKEAYSPSVKPLDITLKEVLVQRWVDSSEAYTPSVKPLDITLIKG